MAQNPSCEQGCVDREREPACCTRWCATWVTYVQYEGCDIMAILALVGPITGCVLMWMACCWTPNLKKGGGIGPMPMIGAPVMAQQPGPAPGVMHQQQQHPMAVPAYR